MRELIWAAAALPLLGMPALAQDASPDPTVISLGGLQTGTLANPGQLSFGGSSGSGAGGGGGSIGAGTSGAASSASQLNFSRTNGTGGAPSGAGAGVSTGSSSTSQTNDTYLYPIYGSRF